MAAFILGVLILVIVGAAVGSYVGSVVGRTDTGAARVSSWAFADGPYRLVLRHQGMCDLVSSNAAVRVGRDAAISYGVDAAGHPSWLTIDGLELRRLRPAPAALRLVDELGARLESEDRPDRMPPPEWPSPSI